MENLELTHHGILGMKWGHRRYQNKDGSLTAAGKKRYGDDDETVDKKAYEESKQKALKSGSAADVLKYQGDLTEKEMRDAISRIRWEQDMAGLAKKDAEAGQRKVDEVLNKVNKGIEIATTTAKAYNMFANVVNAFNGNAKMMPKIDIDVTKGNRQQRRNEEKQRKKEAEEAKSKQTDVDDTDTNKDGAKAIKGTKWKKREKDNNTKKEHDPVETTFDESELEFQPIVTPAPSRRFALPSSVSVSNPTPEARESARIGQTAIAGYLEAPRKRD